MNPVRRSLIFILFAHATLAQLACGALSDVKDIRNDIFGDAGTPFVAGDAGEWPDAGRLGDAGEGVDAAMVDAAGTALSDAGTPTDAGTSMGDAGESVDGGLTSEDAGLPADAGGPSFDGGAAPDAGPPSCSANEYLENGFCVPSVRICSVPNGSGAQTWSGGLWGSCAVTSCVDGHHEENNACVSDTMSCIVLNGSGTQNWASGAWGSCNVTSCDGGYHAESNSCVSDTRSCTVANGSGEASWTGSDWGACTLATCNTGYHEESGACAIDTRSCTIANGSGEESWTGSGWGACILATCNTGYHEESGACVSDTRSCRVANGSGEESWTGNDWGSCSATACEPSYFVLNGECLPNLQSCADGRNDTWCNCNAGYHWDLSSAQCRLDARACDVENGSGSETWLGYGEDCSPQCASSCGSNPTCLLGCLAACIGDWSVCTVSECNPGFYEELNTCVPICGDGEVRGTEACDDGNDNNNDDCLNSCQVATCGDGYLFQQDESCDDGNDDDGDGCSATCSVEPTYRCSISTPSICASVDTSVEWNSGELQPSLDSISGEKATVFIRSGGNISWDFDLSASSLVELIVVADDGLVMGDAQSAQPLIAFDGGSGGHLHIVNMSIQDVGYGVQSQSGNVSLTRVRMDNVAETALVVASGVAKLNHFHLVNAKKGVSVTSGALELTDVQMTTIGETAVSLGSGNATLNRVDLVDLTNGVNVVAGNLACTHVQMASVTGTAVALGSGNAVLHHIDLRDVVHGVAVTGYLDLVDAKIAPTLNSAIDLDTAILVTGSLTMRRTEVAGAKQLLEIKNPIGEPPHNQIFHSWFHGATVDKPIKLRGKTWVANSVFSANNVNESFRTEDGSETLVNLSTFYGNGTPDVMHAHGTDSVMGTIFENNAGANKTHGSNGTLRFKRSYLDRASTGVTTVEDTLAEPPVLYCPTGGCTWDGTTATSDGLKSFAPTVEMYANDYQITLQELATFAKDRGMLPAACGTTNASYTEACFTALLGEPTDFHGDPRPSYGDPSAKVTPGAVEMQAAPLGAQSD